MTHFMANLDKLITEISELTALELSELVKSLEEKFGVSAAAPMAAVAAPVAAGDASPAETEEQTSFTVILANAGTNKIGVIKALREINPQLGLKDAKDIAESAPKEILSGANKATAEEAKKKLTDAGATVELK